MFESFLVERFRGLPQCKVEGMRRVTLLTGKNNVGKTALLEAMFIHSGRYNPNLAMVVNAVRGMNKVSLDNTPEGEAPWLSLFSGYDDSEKIIMEAEIARKGGNKEITTVMLSTLRPGVELTGLGIQMRGHAATEIANGPTKVLKLEVFTGRKRFKEQGQKTTKHFLLVDNKRATVFPTPPVPDLQARLISAHQRDSAEEIATQFSRFQVTGQVDVLVDALLPMEPRLRALSLVFSGEPALHGDIGLKERRFIPLAMMGDGLNRVAALVLGIGSTRGGVVLVDDIDTGLHHSVMEAFWTTILRAAERFNVQVVATTHSDECVRAALGAAALDSAQNDLSLVRLERRGDEILAHTYSASQIDAAIDAGLEVR